MIARDHEGLSVTPTAQAIDLSGGTATWYAAPPCRPEMSWTDRRPASTAFYSLPVPKQELHFLVPLQEGHFPPCIVPFPSHDLQVLVPLHSPQTAMSLPSSAPDVHPSRVPTCLTDG